MVWLSATGLLIFFSVFCLVGLRVFHKGKKSELEQAARLVLEENENEK